MDTDSKRSYFFVFALPRSGTAWLSNFMTHGNSFCFHEGLRNVYNMEQFKGILNSSSTEVVGDVDTQLSLCPKQMVATFPNARYLVIVRDPAEVEKSLAKFGLEGAMEFVLNQFNNAIKVLEDSGVEVRFVEFPQLFQSPEAVWNYLNPTQPCDTNRAQMLSKYNVQEDIHEMLYGVDTRAAGSLVKLESEEA